MNQHPELSRRVQIRTLGPVRPGLSALETLVDAEPAECAAIARRLDVPAVQSLQCRFRLSGVDAGGRVTADGLLQARLSRICVTTLEEFPTTVTEQFTVRFVPEEQVPDDADDPLDLDEDDDIPYRGGAIDLGEAAVEQLALALDPYPRKPGAELPPEVASVDVPGDAGPEEADAADRPNPFAALAARRPADS